MQHNPLETILRHSLGLRRVLDGESAFDNDHSSFPPFNIIVDDHDNPTKFTVEVAVAGFSREQLSVKITKESGLPMLVITGQKTDGEDGNKYMVKGLRARHFTRKFAMSGHMRPIGTKLADGILSVELEIVEPKEHEVNLLIK